MSKNLAEIVDKRSLASTKKCHLRACKVCGTEVLMSKAQKFCSVECKGKWKYLTKKVTTDSQYKLISGNWSRYLTRLLYFGGRRRNELTKEILLKILERQNYKCALSGVDLTCKLEKGTNFWTNASVDRIKAGGSYTEDNIQLVCKAINFWRNTLTVAEFVDWCKKVVDHNKK